MGTLTERMASTLAVMHRDAALALLNSAPKIRAAETLEQLLQMSGFDASAFGHLTGASCLVQVYVDADPKAIARTLAEAGIYFDRHRTVRGEGATAHFDCSVHSYNVTLLVTQHRNHELQEAA
jgi:hypothetical protein